MSGNRGLSAHTGRIIFTVDETHKAPVLRSDYTDKTASHSTNNRQHIPEMTTARYALPGIFILLAAFSCHSFADAKLAQYWSRSQANSEITIDHSSWERLLAAYIEEKQGVNYFRYAAVTPADRETLESYLDRLQSIIVTQASRQQQYAYWINLYNALTVKVILDHYPVKSIRSISYSLLSRGPWKKKLVTVEGMRLGLDDIEHEILRPIFRDNRIHYAVNCASIGCPNLQTTAFTADNINDLLNDAARQYINHPRGVTVHADELVVSSIFKWYAEDFGDNDREIIEHFIQFAQPGLALKLEAFREISGYEYDWRLNE